MNIIANIHRTKLVDSLKYNPNKIISGVINGVRWQLLVKKQITPSLYRFMFVITVHGSRGSFSGTKTLITGDIDVKEAAEIMLRDGYDDEY